MIVSETNISEPALSPLRVEIVIASGPAIVRSNLVALPRASVSVRAEISITPPSSTPSDNAACGDLGSFVKCNSVALLKVNVPAPVPSDKDVTEANDLKSTISTDESSSKTTTVADSKA